eukprot:3199041-Pleurochrysis_carterae.AAC.1
MYIYDVRFRIVQLRARAPLRIPCSMLLPFSPYAFRTPMSRSRWRRLRASASAASRRARGWKISRRRKLCGRRQRLSRRRYSAQQRKQQKRNRATMEAVRAEVRAEARRDLDAQIYPLRT